jgi:SAM-dependent methyltransferase
MTCEHGDRRNELTADHATPLDRADDWNTYNAMAPTYDDVRPGYPDAVFEAIGSYGDFPAEPRVLEVGVGTGQATIRMVQAGWRVLGVEPGAELAAIARNRIANYPDAEICISRFEDIELKDHVFDVVASATAWHWIDPSVAYDKTARVLKSTGIVALWWNAHVPESADPRWVPIRRAYEREAPELAVLARLTPDRPNYDPRTELQACGHFCEIKQEVFGFEVTYSAERFLSLLETYASHRNLDRERRRRLYDELTTAITDELDGSVTKPYEALLLLARIA